MIQDIILFYMIGFHANLLALLYGNETTNVTYLGNNDKTLLVL